MIDAASGLDELVELFEAVAEIGGGDLSFQTSLIVGKVKMESLSEIALALRVLKNLREAEAVRKAYIEKMAEDMAAGYEIQDKRIEMARTFGRDMALFHDLKKTY